MAQLVIDFSPAKETSQRIRIQKVHIIRKQRRQRPMTRNPYHHMNDEKELARFSLRANHERQQGVIHRTHYEVYRNKPFTTRVGTRDTYTSSSHTRRNNRKGRRDSRIRQAPTTVPYKSISGVIVWREARGECSAGSQSKLTRDQARSPKLKSQNRILSSTREGAL